MAINSPGSISRTKLAPTMSSAAVSLATTQPRSSRPSTSGRMPCGSRAAYSVVSSMKTSEKAPRSCGSTSSAACSSVRSGCAASSAVIMSVSVVLCIARCRSVSRGAGPPRGWSRVVVGQLARLGAPLLDQPGSSPVLVRLPLWASAIAPAAVERNVGWAFSQTLAPVVE